MTTAISAPIVLDERGVAYIEGTATKVIDVALLKETSGVTPEELQQELPYLTLAEIHAALFYYHANKDALDAEIRSREELVERLRDEAGESAFSRRMRAEGRLP